MSVLIFGLAAGHLESRASVIRRVVVATAAIAGLFSLVQAVLEFGYPDPNFRVDIRPEAGVKPPDGDGGSARGSIDLYGHGGSVFWLISSLGFDGKLQKMSAAKRTCSFFDRIIFCFRGFHRGNSEEQFISVIG